jgi:hypothetical protein
MRVRPNQQGLAMLILVFMIALAFTGFLLNLLNPTTIKIERDKQSARALAEAKDGLIGFTIQANVVDSAYLPNPDLKLSAAISEGSQSGMAGGVDISLLGKLPWRSLGMPALKDGWGECLWYAVSGRFKTSPQTTVLNWDTLGQIDVIQEDGSLLAINLAAVIIAPNVLLSGQNRLLTNVDTPQCGGNYDARNYLDTYNVVNSVFGEVNYFLGSVNNRAALNTNNKRFVVAKNDFYNDGFVFITTADIFRPLILRVDFSNQISALLDDVSFQAHLQTVAISGNKGTANIDCNTTSNATNRIFCQNWSEMLLLTALPAPAPILIDGVATPACTRVVVFGGQRAAIQSRATVVDKNTVANYLEGSNLAAFATPVANNSSFVGNATFNAAISNADVLRCI